MLDAYIKKDSPWISFSLENAYQLECNHLIFVFVKTHVCLPLHPLSSSPWFSCSLYLSSCYLKYLAIWLSTPFYIANNVCFRDTSLNVQWDYKADLCLKPTKYSKILKQKFPSRVILRCMLIHVLNLCEKLKPRNVRKICICLQA